jgi:hypothetical protein
VSAQTRSSHLSPRHHGHPQPAVITTAPAAWRVVNINPAERVKRVVSGLCGILLAVVVLSISTSAPAILAGSILLLTGCALVGTGLVGHSPLRRAIGRSPQFRLRHRSR